MSKYINADELMKEFIEFVTPSNLDYSIPIPTWNDAVSLLGSAPDADVVEVVRCKDCRYYLKGKIYPDAGRWCHKLADGLDMPPDGYCSYGERKADE